MISWMAEDAITIHGGGLATLVLLVIIATLIAITIIAIG